MDNFISIHTELPAINHLCEHKKRNGYITKILFDILIFLYYTKLIMFLVVISNYLLNFS